MSTDEKKINIVKTIGIFMISWAFSLGMMIIGHECPEAKPLREGTAVEQAPPSPPPSAVEAKPEAPTVVPAKVEEHDWKRAMMTPEMAGEWEDIDHKPVPLLKLWVKRDNSKTDFNLRYEDRGNVSGGCGFNSDGEAWCQVFDDENRKVPKSVKTTVILEQRYPGALRAIIDGVGTFEVTRPIE